MAEKIGVVGFRQIEAALFKRWPATQPITGYLVRKANSLGIAVPVTETVYSLAKGVEYAARLRREAV